MIGSAYEPTSFARRATVGRGVPGLIETGVLKNVELPHEEVERAKAEGISEQSIQVSQFSKH